MDWLWVFAALQIQVPQPPSQDDRVHFEGGASCGWHLCLTYSGRRSVRCEWDEGVEEYEQRAGCLYATRLVSIQVLALSPSDVSCITN